MTNEDLTQFVELSEQAELPRLRPMKRAEFGDLCDRVLAEALVGHRVTVLDRAKLGNTRHEEGQVAYGRKGFVIPPADNCPAGRITVALDTPLGPYALINICPQNVAIDDSVRRFASPAEVLPTEALDEAPDEVLDEAPGQMPNGPGLRLV